MAHRGRRKRSHLATPFAEFQEFLAPLSPDFDLELDFKVAPVSSSRAEPDWKGFFADAHQALAGYADAAGTVIDLREVELTIGMVALAKVGFDFLQAAEAMPRQRDVQRQLSKLGQALRAVGSLAQGGRADDEIDPNPRWIGVSSENEFQREYMEAIEPTLCRSRLLHPMLEDGLTLAVESIEDARRLFASDPDRFGACADFDDGEPTLSSTELKAFFDRLPMIIEVVETAEAQAACFAAKLDRPEHRGKPDDLARTWLLTRLMWIWRDVQGGDLTLSMRRIEGRAEMTDPRPEGCMAFVAAALERIDPLTARNLPALERRLHRLKATVPAKPLVTWRQPT